MPKIIDDDDVLRVEIFIDRVVIIILLFKPIIFIVKFTC